MACTHSDEYLRLGTAPIDTSASGLHSRLDRRHSSVTTSFPLFRMRIVRTPGPTRHPRWPVEALHGWPPSRAYEFRGGEARSKCGGRAIRVCGLAQVLGRSPTITSAVHAPATFARIRRRRWTAALALGVRRAGTPREKFARRHAGQLIHSQVETLSASYRLSTDTPFA